MGWCREVLRKNDRVKLQNDNIWLGFLTLAKASQSVYPQMVRQEGVLSADLEIVV